MTLWWQALVLLSYTLTCVDTIPSVVLQTKYINSFRLTRVTRCRVQQLLTRYKEEQLGSKNFEDRSQHLKDLPLLSTDFNNWLQLTDRQRLDAAFTDMHAFWRMLEWKKKQLSATVTRSTLTQSFEHIQFDLRDLINQVNSQMNYIGSTTVRPFSTMMHRESAQSSSSGTQWDSRVEGYIILRDLDLYLTKLARDFLLLATNATLSSTDRQTGKGNKKS